MQRKRLRSRLLLAIVAAWQALSPGLAVIADAQADAYAVAQPVASHVEAFGFKHAYRGHLDNCALCQIVARLAPSPDAAAVLVSRRWHASAPAIAHPSAPQSSYYSGLNSRAPPAS